MMMMIQAAISSPRTTTRMSMMRLSPRCCCRRLRWLSTSRQQAEEEHHLGRGLSRPKKIEKQKQWWQMAKKWTENAPEWTLPRELYNNNDNDESSSSSNKSKGIVSQAKYEFDALKAIHDKSFVSNCLLEIRDVRLPASSHHPSFTRLAKHRLHLICYTHADLMDAATRDRVEQWTNKSWPDARCIFVDTRETRSDPECFDILYDGLLHQLEQSGGANVALTVGVPNVGKSSVLMALLRTGRHRGLIPKKGTQVSQQIHTKDKKRKKGLKKATVPGIHDKPGKTRELTEYLLREKPRTFFLDVPGLTPPPFFFEERPEAWFAYGAANLLALSNRMTKDPHIQTGFCDYVLHCLNRDGIFHYVEKLGLDAPTNDIQDALSRVGNKYANKSNYDPDKLQLKRCETFLKLFNTGNFGPVVLDDIRRPYVAFRFSDKHFRS